MLKGVKCSRETRIINRRKDWGGHTSSRNSGMPSTRHCNNLHTECSRSCRTQGTEGVLFLFFYRR
jgi:hypothetical protein